MAPEMDQFYRSTMAIYKVSARPRPCEHPSGAQRLGQRWRTEGGVAAACSGEEGVEPAGLSCGVGGGGLWGVSHPSPGLRLPGRGLSTVAQ